MYEESKNNLGSVGNFSSGLAGSTAKETPTSRELMILSKEIAEITMMSEELMKRLAPVLSNVPEVSGDNAKTPQEQLSEIPADIRRNRENLAQPRYTLKSILSRLEI